MATHKSAVKKHRQSLDNRTRNRGNRSEMRSAVKKFRQTLAAGEVDAARALLNPTLGAVDHAAKLGAIHDNAAARTKSRLTRALNKLGA